MTKVCPECGSLHEADNGPCQRCGHPTLVDRGQTPTDSDNTPPATEWECTNCGERHVKNNPPCRVCGGMDYDVVYLDDAANAGATSEGGLPQADADRSILSDAGDVLFNKSLTRQLIDLELLIITGFTWVFFLITEVIYHRWRINRGEAHLSQYSYAGGKGEGVITKAAKVLFWIQIILVALGILALFA